MNNFVKIENIDKTYLTDAGDKVHALDNLSLSVPADKLTILIGQTGCGKTTLLNIIAGLDRKYTGNIEYAEKSKLNVSCVFQHYTLFPWRNIINNVAFSLEMQGIGKHKRFTVAEELLAKVGLSGFEKSYPHELSGGMRQRAAIAQALAKKPDLLLMDEPFGALDDATRRDIQKTFLQLMKTENLTTLMVTHNIEEALIMGDHISVFSPRPGKIVAEHEIKLQHPRDPMAEDFVKLFTKLREDVSQVYASHSLQLSVSSIHSKRTLKL